MSITLSGLEPARFEAIVDGKATRLYVLANSQGAEMTVCNYGGVIVSLMMPDRQGKMGNVVLGMDSIEGLTHGPEATLGAAIGRYGNRIGGARFTLDGVEYHVGMSQAPNSLHGGHKGFNKVVWDVTEADSHHITLHYVSADGEEGFPGQLDVTMTYELTEQNEVRITYSATTDKLTLCNLTNHSYFNLRGIQAVTTNVGDHLLTLNADRYCPTDAVNIPYGRKDTVEGTPFDFRTPHAVGERIDDDNEQLRFGTGYDHSFCVNQHTPGELTWAATLEDPVTGRVMKTYTTEPGLQVYTGNWLTGFTGIGGCTYPKRSGICFEAQHHPDSPNIPAFEQATLAPGQVYRQTTVYAFSTQNEK